MILGWPLYWGHPFLCRFSGDSDGLWGKGRQGLLIQFYKCLRYPNWRISIILLLRELIGEISMWGIPLIRIGYEGIKSRKR